MRQISIQLDAETIQQIADLAEWWGLPSTRHNTPVISRIVERVHRDEFAKRELEKFDEAQRLEDAANPGGI